ncbi:protein trichome birefringence-like 6 isoform X2 [Cryptomeria japonica]|uniref:protein trichome birefringence-like 6 isoform X2 n=1 Tax=Cryptomeria japonica TaxID=3369 RepID=UPI0025ABD23A|nr:protein trichome birefringence-like 6 isoform X2 [Cryptomeria japonica]
MGMPMSEIKKVQQVVANNRITSLLILATAVSLIIFCSFLPSSSDHDDYEQSSIVNFGFNLPHPCYHHDNFTPNCSEITGESSNSNMNVSGEVHDGIEGLKNGSSSQEFEKVTEFGNAHQNSSPPVIQLKEAAATVEIIEESSNSNMNVSGEVHDGIEGLKNGSSSQEIEKVTEFANDTQNSSPPVIKFKEEAAALESDFSKEETGDGLADTEWKRAQMTEFSQCDLYSGKWVYDESYPLYPAGECPYMSADFNCQGNERQDTEYTKWRWQPSQCDLPRLNATDLLERVKGKRVMFIGDSINRNQWESMLCILGTVVPQNRKSFGRSQDGGSTSFVVQDYNCSFEFFWAPFLVEQGSVNNGNISKEILKLDAIEKHGAYWRGVDILVFNSAHWWTHGNKVELRNFYMESNYLHPELDPMVAFKRGLTTWANWIDQNIDPAKTKVFFRGFSPMHFRTVEES